MFIPQDQYHPHALSLQPGDQIFQGEYGSEVDKRHIHNIDYDYLCAEDRVNSAQKSRAGIKEKSTANLN